MKDFIKIKIRENLSELLTKPKGVFDNGRDHNIYTSPNKPNVLYKIGKKEVVDQWLKVFNSAPNLFPKVIKTGTLKDGNMYVEKLNTKAALADWSKLDSAFTAAGVIDDEDAIFSVDEIFVNIVSGYMTYKDTAARLGNNREMVMLFKKWVEFLVKADAYVKKFGYEHLDIRRKNFAYDSTGKIKAIDV